IQFIAQIMSCDLTFLFAAVLGFALLSTAIIPSLRRASVFILIVSVFHLQFGGSNWFFRYEAYIITGLLIAFVLEFGTFIQNKYPDGIHWKNWTKVIIVLVLFLLPILQLRGIYSLKKSIAGSESIYLQQMQMARLVSHLPSNKGIA